MSTKTLQWLYDNVSKVKQCTECGALNIPRTRRTCYRCGNNGILFNDPYFPSETLLKAVIKHEIDKYGGDTKIKC